MHKMDEIIYGNGFEANQDFTNNKIKNITGTVNVKENEQSIDYSAVKNDYPFSLNVENVVHAIKQSASSTSKS